MSSNRIDRRAFFLSLAVDQSRSFIQRTMSETHVESLTAGKDDARDSRPFRSASRSLRLDSTGNANETSSTSNHLDDEARRKKILSKMWGKGNKSSHKVRELEKCSASNGIEASSTTNEENSNSINMNKPFAVVKPIMLVKSDLVGEHSTDDTYLNATPTTTVSEPTSSSNNNSSRSEKKKTKKKSRSRSKSRSDRHSKVKFVGFSLREGTPLLFRKRHRKRIIRRRLDIVTADGRRPKRQLLNRRDRKRNLLPFRTNIRRRVRSESPMELPVIVVRSRRKLQMQISNIDRRNELVSSSLLLSPADRVGSLRFPIVARRATAEKAPNREFRRIPVVLRRPTNRTLVIVTRLRRARVTITGRDTIRPVRRRRPSRLAVGTGVDRRRRRADRRPALRPSLAVRPRRARVLARASRRNAVVRQRWKNSFSKRRNRSNPCRRRKILTLARRRRTSFRCHRAAARRISSLATRLRASRRHRLRSSRRLRNAS